MAATTAGSVAVFAGGGSGTDAADVYDPISDSWTSATLSQPTNGLAAAAIGPIAFFAGGYTANFNDVVEVFNSTSGEWTTTKLPSGPRANLAMAAVGSKVLFAGGDVLGGAPSNIVDIFDLSTRLWTVAVLRQARDALAGTSHGSRAFFAGGGVAGGSPSAVVDIYDSITNIWDVAYLSKARHNLKAVTAGRSLLAELAAPLM
jgi:hypothetical protein